MAKLLMHNESGLLYNREEMGNLDQLTTWTTVRYFFQNKTKKYNLVNSYNHRDKFKKQVLFYQALNGGKF